MNLNALVAELKDFPHVQRKLELYWGERECRSYLISLKVSDRPARKGFPFTVVKTIDDLLELHDITFPRHVPAKGTWDHIY